MRTDLRTHVDPDHDDAVHALEEKAERLEKELKRIRPFVQHLWDCVSNFPMTPPQGFNRNSCSCGLQAAQEKGE